MEEIRKILAAIRLADEKFNLIEDGDRVAVGVSGGKDSLVLAYALSLYQRFPNKHFSLVAITLDLGFPRFSTDHLSKFFADKNIEFYLENATTVYPILVAQQDLQHMDHLPCSICSRMKKAAMDHAAIRLGCNKVAFAHHADDALETLLMNEINGGRVATFAPKMHLEKDDVTFIRPLILAFEASIERCAHQLNLPVFPSACPADKHTGRENIKQLLGKIYKTYPMAQRNFLTMLTNYKQADLWYDEIFFQTQTSGLTVSPAITGNDKTDVIYIRMKVFVEEQKCPLDEEISREENECEYFLMRYHGKRVGTIRFFQEKDGSIHIGRYALLKEYRGHGYGRILFQWMENYLYSRFGDIKIIFGGQAYLRQYYESLGYVTDGVMFQEAGIDHFHFTKFLSHGRKK